MRRKTNNILRHTLNESYSREKITVKMVILNAMNDVNERGGGRKWILGEEGDTVSIPLI